LNHLLFVLRRSALLGIGAVLVFALAACGAGDGNGNGTDNGGNGGTDRGSTATVTDGRVEITSDNLAFDADTIEAPAGEAFTIVLVNAENIPHNLSVYTEEGGDLIARGDIINEGQTDEIEVSALEPGEYFFVCDLHVAEMRGVLRVEG
jgi:plastocyanin